MACHETKSCARCKSPFECKVGNILQCQCNGITFNETEKAFISENYQDCLCRECLLAIKRELKYQPVKDRIQHIFSIFKLR